MDQRATLLSEITAFIAERGMASSTFGRLAVNDGKFVARIEAGGDVTSRTAERVRGFMAAQRAVTRPADRKVA
jgi:hypothetical protein